MKYLDLLNEWHKVSISNLKKRGRGAKKWTKTPIVLKGDRKSQFDAFVQVMQMLQKNKMSDVSILVLESKEQ